MSNLAVSCFFGKNGNNFLKTLVAAKSLNEQFFYESYPKIGELKLINHLQKAELTLIGNKSRFENTLQDRSLSALSKYSGLVKKGESLRDSNRIFLRINGSGTYLSFIDPGLKSLSDQEKDKFFGMLEDFINDISKYIQV